MNDRDFQAWADKIDSGPSYATRTAGRILSMRFARERAERRQLPAWKISAARREYQLLLMQARIEMEELV
jgi:hypothetical protein